MGRSTVSHLVLIAAIVIGQSVQAEQPNRPPTKVALLVGINDYDAPDFPDLRHAERDATALAAELEEVDFKTIVLTGSAKGERRATRDNIREQLSSLLKENQIGRQDIVVVAFSGHGQQLPTPALETSRTPSERSAPGDASAVENYFAPCDARLDRPESQFSLRQLTDEILAPYGVRNLILVDASRWPIPAPPETDEPLAEPLRPTRNGTWETNRKLPADTVILFSCSPNESTVESDEWQQGVFFKGVIEGLAQYRARGQEIYDVPSIPQMIYEMSRAAATKRPEDVAFQSMSGDGEMDRGLQDWCRLKAPVDVPAVRQLFLEGEAAVLSKDPGPDFPGGLKLLRQAAQRGHLEALCLVGEMYKSGDGVLQSNTEAIRCFRHASLRREPYGDVLLGTMYLEGRGVREDHAEAVARFEKAARAGHPEGQFALGLMYVTGQGVSKNEKKGSDWYRKAADQNHAKSQVNLGRLYEDGRGVPEDHKQAASLYRKAADTNRSAQYHLGRLYLEGKGVEKSETEATLWFTKAAKQGDYDAQQELYELEFKKERAR